MTLKELREKRAKAIKDARAIIDLADGESRAMTNEETVQYDAFFAEGEQLRSHIEREERSREAERELAEALELEEERNANLNGGGGDRETRTNNELVMATFRGWLSNGTVGGDGADQFRALSAGVDADGGYLVVPEVFVNLLIKAIDDETIIRGLSTVYPLSQGASIGIPTLDADPADADWTTELATGSADSTMAFGKRIMAPNPMAKRIKISKQLIRQSAIPVEAIVAQRLGYKFGITQEKAYMTGDGVDKPLGLFTASTNGISTARDVSEDNTATEVTVDGLKSAKYSLKAGHMQNSNWVMHRDIVKLISKLKDGDGQYLWQEAVREGEPDRLLGRPVRMSEFAPNTIAANAYVGMLGDFSHYWILDSLSMQMQRLDELYAEANQVGFIGRYEGDGAPVLQEAFARVQLGA